MCYFRCKKYTETVSGYEVTAANGQRRRGGICTMCGARKSQFVSSTGIGLRNKLNNRLPVEIHLPGHKFTGSGLLPDVTPKFWSIRVDQSAYHYDLCYAKHKNTAVRNSICDKVMLASLDAIHNPTMCEQVDRSIVKPPIGTKVRFGLGLKKEKKRSLVG